MRIRHLSQHSYALLALLALLFSSCHNDYTPKPYAYLRIDLPEHEYWLVDTLPMSIDGQPMPGITLPFIFEANDSVELTLKKPRQICTFKADGSIKPDRIKYDEVWLDLKYPQWDGVVFLTYKQLKDSEDLRSQIDTSSRFLEQHYSFASGIEEQGYEDPEHRVYGTVYYLKGSKVASTCQFWLTDSTNHFLRGALYLNTTPNNDSLAPVIDYIQADIEHLVETLRWR
ncbi:MAG: hypothetical protein J6V98_05320 [Bacteroidales bacterium]|nr:hypothetical protein [Bacteroidales bacterium]